MKTQKMLFNEDKHVNGVLTYRAGEVYDISVDTGSVARWLKRGATIIEEAPVQEPVKAVEEVEQAPVQDDEALAALGGEEEVVNEELKKENKKAKKSSK